MSDPTEFIRKWLNAYDDKSPIDYLVATVANAIMGLVGTTVELDIMSKTENNDLNYTGRDAGIIAIKAIRDVADKMEKEICSFNTLN